mmetsp:Transcript_7/g.14  ORF Transcript_7/g.14 Transcript_7/m.14 type:complete len:80 (-) Transcript_7:179-418(-)
MLQSLYLFSSLGSLHETRRDKTRRSKRHVPIIRCLSLYSNSSLSLSLSCGGCVRFLLTLRLARLQRIAKNYNAQKNSAA